MKIGALNAQICEVFQMSPFSTSSQTQVSDKAACHVQLTVYPAPGVVAFVEIRAYRRPEAGTVPAKLVARRALSEALSELNCYVSSSDVVSLKDCPQAAINFGDDVNTAPTSPTVPVGNTGNTSTGRVL